MYPLYFNQNEFKNVNGSAKFNQLFKKRMDWQKVGSGMGVACFKLVAALHNRRFIKEDRRVMDMNPKSFLKNLERALIMKSYETKLDISHENMFLSVLKAYEYDFLHFKNSPHWTPITEENLSQLEFPTITVESNQAKVYDDIADNNAYWLSVGSYECKTAMHYLTTVNPEKKFFEAQTLNADSSLYLNIRDDLFPDRDVTIIKLRIPSSHKQSGFHAEGYKVTICFQKVQNFENGHPENLEIRNGHVNPESLLFPDYYFRNIFLYSICTCKTGRRDLGFCAHRLAVALYFGTNLDFSRKKYTAIDLSSFRSSYSIPQDLDN